jgi:hypothetical protein
MLEYRKYYYEPVSVDGIRELDYLKSKIDDMDFETATKFTITSATEQRPDLISKIFYDNFDLGWLIHTHNKILDPFTEYYIGRTIDIPFLDDYFQFYNRFSKEF